MHASNLLVIGYGNTLRRDDGAGVKVVETVAALNLPGIHTVTCHQLLPELVATLARTSEVIFVDAAVGSAGDLGLREIEAAAGCRSLDHVVSPSLLLAMAGELFGRCPRAWMLSIPVEDLGVGEGLSSDTERKTREAVGIIKSFRGCSVAA